MSKTHPYARTPLTGRGRRRALRALLALPVSACIAPPALAQAGPNPQALLVASDAIRNPGQPFRVTVTLTEYERGQQVEASTLASYARTLEGSGQFATLVQFVQPARDTGKLMLKAGNDMWFYDPGTKASIRISPQQRLLGQAANGDIVTVNFARDYKASLAAEELTQDGERKERRAYKLALAASSPDAAYPAIELWVDVDQSSPIKARFLSDSGRLLKTAFYRRFENQLGARRPTETVIIDGLNPQLVTIVRFSEFAARNIPPQWFQREFLPRFQPE
jgi:hypothetical protein